MIWLGLISIKASFILIDHLYVSCKAIIKRSDDQDRDLEIGKILLIFDIGVGRHQDIEAM